MVMQIKLLVLLEHWIGSRRSRSRGVSVENLPGRVFGVPCCACVSFAWEIVRDSPMVNFDSQTMNKHIKMRLGHRRRSLCCLETQNAPWRHWRMPSIYSEKERFIYLWSLEFRSWLRPRAVSRLRARFAPQDYKVATLGIKNAHKLSMNLPNFILLKQTGNKQVTSVFNMPQTVSNKTVTFASTWTEWINKKEENFVALKTFKSSSGF